ncbi:hypothetical protein ACR2XN_28390, partial [Klebsiella pneumoniae]
MPIFEVNSTPSISSQSTISLSTTVAMVVSNVPLPPTQATKPKKVKTKKPTSSVSQKSLVVTTTTQPEGSVLGTVSGEGRGEHQVNPKDKFGEKCVNQPSHPTSSQKAVVVEKEISTSLVTSSQKDVTIENSSQPGTQHKRVRDTSSPNKTFIRKKKVKTTQGAHGDSHTEQLKITDFVSVPSQIQLDVTSINVESQPISQTIQTHLQTSLSESPTPSLDVEMIQGSIPDSPSLTFMEKPHSDTSDRSWHSKKRPQP